ncbi:protein CREG1-like [Hermetia illucens]|nr:protein CREG1-like [Hermetia illucens]
MWFSKFMNLTLVVLLVTCLTAFAFPQRGSRPENDHAKIARRLVHKSNWASTGTISTEEAIRGFPMVNVILIADSGVDEASTGNIYFYLTPLDYTAKDVEGENKVTMLLTDEQDLSCSKSGNTPMGHNCPRAMISGRVNKLDPNSDEYKRAQEAFLSRHPSLSRVVLDSGSTSPNHGFFLCKLDISNILVFAGYTGPSSVSLDDYLKADLE